MMNEKNDTPGNPIILAPLSDEANKLIDHFHTLDITLAPTVEPALLAPFWATGDFVNLSGPPGCGKTWLAADIAMAAMYPTRDGCALGGLLKFDLDRLGTCNIAIIDAENTYFRWSSLLVRKLLAAGIDPSEFTRNRILYIRPNELGLQSSKNWEKQSIRLAEALAWSQVKFIIGDTIARIWAPEDINSAAWIQQGFAPFRDACQRYGISGLMLTHVSKSRQASKHASPIGTVFQEGQADGQITIARTKIGKDAGLELTLHKSRRSFWIQQGSTVKLRFTADLSYEPVGDWQTIWPHEPPDGDSDDFLPENSTKEKIWNLLSKSGSDLFAAKDIAAELGVADTTVRNHLRQLLNDDKVERQGNGPSTRWRSIS